MQQGEATYDDVTARRKERLKSKTRNIRGDFVPAPYVNKNGVSSLPLRHIASLSDQSVHLLSFRASKHIVSSGSYQATFSGPVEALSPKLRDQKPTEKPLRNIFTRPGKKGTGYGYVGVTIGMSFCTYEAISWRTPLSDRHMWV